MSRKVIPIEAESAGVHAPHAPRPLSRREWLKGTGVLIGTLAFPSILATLAPSRVWAVDMQALDTHQGAVLLAFVKQQYPHKTLDDAVYALVVKDLDAKAQKDPAVRQQLADGVKQLDALNGSDWTKRSPADQARDVAADAAQGRLRHLPGEPAAGSGAQRLHLDHEPHAGFAAGG